MTVFGVLQTGQTTLTFVSGFSTEGSVTLETLKVFMQLLQSYNLSMEISFFLFGQVRLRERSRASAESPRGSLVETEVFPVALYR